MVAKMSKRKLFAAGSKEALRALQREKAVQGERSALQRVARQESMEPVECIGCGDPIEKGLLCKGCEELAPKILEGLV
jgi:hypothetical protein